MVSVPDTVQVSVVPLQIPPREEEHTVEPFDVVIEMTVAACAAGTYAPSKVPTRRRDMISNGRPLDAPLPPLGGSRPPPLGGPINRSGALIAAELNPGL